MLEFSCADYTFPLLGRVEALALVRLLQFDLVDIGLFERSRNFRPSDLKTSPRAFIAGARNDLAATGLRPADVFLQVGEDLSQGSANDPVRRVRQAGRDIFSMALELCSAVRCAHITGLPGELHGDQRRDLARAAEEAAWRVEAAAMEGVVYSIEPHIGSICGDTEGTRAFLSQVPGLTLTLDYGHFICECESNDAIHTLLPHASHLHVRGAAPGRLQTPADESMVDFRHILKHRRAQYSGRFALEYVWSSWHGCNRTDNVSETILLRQQIAQMEANLDLGGPQHV